MPISDADRPGFQDSPADTSGNQDGLDARITVQDVLDAKITAMCELLIAKGIFTPEEFLDMFLSARCRQEGKRAEGM